MTRIAIPAVTLLIVVAGIVGLAGWNRSAEPRQVIGLTERELSLPYGYEDGLRDGAPLKLNLQIEYRADALDARNWLSEQRLRDIGFTIAVPASAPEAAVTYRRVPPRVAWVALEYDGPLFQAIEQRRALEREKDTWRGQLEPTRLVPVDAAPDFETLRARYPTNHLIVRAVIALSYLGPSERGPLIYGTVREIVPSTVAVPRRLRDALIGLPPRPSTGPDGPHTLVPPRYVADIASGPLGVLYLRAIKRVGG
jgi:hypothetical protein